MRILLARILNFGFSPVWQHWMESKSSPFTSDLRWQHLHLTWPLLIKMWEVLNRFLQGRSTEKIASLSETSSHVSLYAYRTFCVRSLDRTEGSLSPPSKEGVGKDGPGGNAGSSQNKHAQQQTNQTEVCWISTHISVQEVIKKVWWKKNVCHGFKKRNYRLVYHVMHYKASKRSVRHFDAFTTQYWRFHDEF